MYFFCYYMGSSIVGWLSGHVLHSWEWGGLVVWLLAGLAIATMIALFIARTTPSTRSTPSPARDSR